MSDLMRITYDVCAYCGSDEGECFVIVRAIPTMEEYFDKVSHKRFKLDYLERSRDKTAFAFDKTYCKSQKK